MWWIAETGEIQKSGSEWMFVEPVAFYAIGSAGGSYGAVAHGRDVGWGWADGAGCGDGGDGYGSFPDPGWINCSGGMDPQHEEGD